MNNICVHVAAQFDVDYLEAISSEASADPNGLTRESLFVKFDPLVDKPALNSKTSDQLTKMYSLFLFSAYGMYHYYLTFPSLGLFLPYLPSHTYLSLTFAPSSSFAYPLLSLSPLPLLSSLILPSLSSSPTLPYLCFLFLPYPTPLLL